MLCTENVEKILSGTSEIHLRLTEPEVKGVGFFCGKMYVLSLSKVI